MAGKISKELALLVTGKDVSATKTLRGVNQELNKLGSIAAKGGANVARNIEQSIVIGGGAAVGALGYAIKTAGDFEASLNTINTIARATPQGLAAIGTGIRKLARDTGGDLGDLTNGYYDLLSAGVSVKDAQGVLSAAVILGGGALATTSESVDLLTTALNSYGLDAGKATYVSDLFAKAVELGKVRASEIAASLADVAPIAHTAGISLEEIAASYGALTQQGVPAAEVTTQMSRAILELQKPSSTVLALQTKLGKSYADLARQKGLHVALVTLRKDADAAGVPIAELFGRVEGYKYLLSTTGTQQKIYDDSLKAMGDAAGTAAGQFGERQKGLNTQMARLKANVDDAAITIGTQLLPIINELAKSGVDWLGGHQAEIAQFSKDLAVNIRDAVTWGKSLDWASIGNALKAGAGFAGALVNAFASAPPWVQQFLVAGFVANKFTGGAVGSIIGELGKGLIKGVLGLNAGVGNINAGVVMGGAGGVAAGGGKGGLLKAAAAGLGTGLAIEAVLGVQQEISAQTTAQAQGVHGTLRASLEASPPLTDLQTKLAAIDTGIAQIQSNPLLVLVQGEALNELVAMRAEVVAAIGRGPVDLSPEARQAAADQRQAIDRVWDATERNRLAIVSAVGSAASFQAQQAAAAMRDILIPAPIVNVNVDVTARAVSQQTTQFARVGNSKLLAIT